MGFVRAVLYLRRALKYISGERGNVESSLVLVPLLFLFLCSLQIISAIYLRNGEQIAVQSEASKRAISGEIRSGDQVIEIGNVSGSFGRKILLTHEQKSIPTLIPGLAALIGKKMTTSLTGVAVIEAN